MSPVQIFPFDCHVFPMFKVCIYTMLVSFTGLPMETHSHGYSVEQEKKNLKKVY